MSNPVPIKSINTHLHLPYEYSITLQTHDWIKSKKDRLKCVNCDIEINKGDEILYPTCLGNTKELLDLKNFIMKYSLREANKILIDHLINRGFYLIIDLKDYSDMYMKYLRDGFDDSVLDEINNKDDTSLSRKDYDVIDVYEIYNILSDLEREFGIVIKAC